MANGWLPLRGAALIEVINPATEQSVASVPLGTSADAEKAIAAARAAFPGFSNWSVSDRLALLGRIRDVYERRLDEIAEAISTEMGAPRPWRNLTRPGRVSAISRRP
jgi:aldehyde dehydrogenase (NAD+)